MGTNDDTSKDSGFSAASDAKPKPAFSGIVGQSDRDTLLLIIRTHISPGTRVMRDMWIKGLQLPKRPVLHSSHSQPPPKLRRPGHRCAHPAQWKYKVGSQTKYTSYRNIQRSLRKLSTVMVLASALWRGSFCQNIIKHIANLYAQRCVNIVAARFSYNPIHILCIQFFV